MIRLLTILSLIITLNCSAQDFIIKKDLEKPTRIVLKDYGWFTLSLGTVILSSSWFIDQKWGPNSGVDKPMRNVGLGFSTTVSVGLYIISWERVSKPLKTSKHPRWL
jgi:Mlc titration factor MtfA (ptsG expression regulator)